MAKKKTTKKPAKKSAASRKKAAASKKAPARKKAAAKKKAPAKKKAASRKAAARKKTPAKKKATAKKRAASKKPASRKKAAAKKTSSKKKAVSRKKTAPKKKAPTKKKAAPRKAASKKKAPPKKTAAGRTPAARKAASKPKASAPKKKAPTTSPPKATKASGSKTSRTETAQKKGQPVKQASAQSKTGGSRARGRPEDVTPTGLSPVRSSKDSGPLVCVQSGTTPRKSAEGAGAQGALLVPPQGVVPGAGPGGALVPDRAGLVPPTPAEALPDISQLSLDENRGALSAHGYRLLLMHPESIIEIQTALEEKVGLEAGQIMFRGGYVIGLREARRQKDADVSEEEILEHVAARCSAHGWGIFKVESLDLWRHELVFRVEHSPFAYSYGKSTTGVDHLIRGVFSGVCEVIFDKKVVATEAMCRAMGDPHCQFLVG